MTAMNPPDEFLKRAAECQQMAKVTRDPASKARGTGWPRDGFDVPNDLTAQVWRRPTKCRRGDVPSGGRPILSNVPRGRPVGALEPNLPL